MQSQSHQPPLKTPNILPIGITKLNINTALAQLMKKPVRGLFTAKKILLPPACNVLVNPNQAQNL